MSVSNNYVSFMLNSYCVKTDSKINVVVYTKYLT